MTSSLRPTAFPDRDGVLDGETGYPNRPGQRVHTPVAARGVARLTRAGVAGGRVERDRCDRDAAMERWLASSQPGREAA